LARFHIDVALERCESGLPAAEEATRALPNDPRAWTTLANVLTVNVHGAEYWLV